MAHAQKPDQAGEFVRTAEAVLLIIADISGYTRYMTANAKTLSHSHVIITELVEAIIKHVQLPLQVAKLEGDAIFLVCRKRDSVGSWTDTRRRISEQLLTFFAHFSGKVVELSESTTCTCNACTHIEKLRLKIVVHSGEALFHQVGGFLELAGLDVIIVHRLLKNSVQADQYLLLTESARQDLDFPDRIRFAESSEAYDELGRIGTAVYFPEAKIDHGKNAPKPRLSAHSDPRMAVTRERFTVRFARSLRLYQRLWFAPLKKRNSGRKDFNHLIDGTTRFGHLSFALLTLLLTPLMLPVGVLFVLGHAARHPATDCKSDRHGSGCVCNVGN